MQIQGFHLRLTKSDSLEEGWGICILTRFPSSDFDATTVGENTNLEDYYSWEWDWSNRGSAVPLIVNFLETVPIL